MTHKHNFMPDHEDVIGRKIVKCSKCGLEAVGLYDEDTLYAAIVYKPLYEADDSGQYTPTQNETTVFLLTEDARLNITKDIQ